MRAGDREADRPAQRGGSPAPGEKVRAIEVPIAHQKANPEPVACGTAPPVHSDVPGARAYWRRS
jgi:hypothetical protein